MVSYFPTANVWGNRLSPTTPLPGSNDGVDVIIIGAGMAGLSAAYNLTRAGFTVLIVEARGRIGGRVWTDRTLLGTPIDMGAQFINVSFVYCIDWRSALPTPDLLSLSAHRWQPYIGLGRVRGPSYVDDRHCRE